MRSPTTSGSTTRGSTHSSPRAGPAGSGARREGTLTADRPGWRTPPDRAALAWAAATVGRGARVRSVRPLGGGIAEATDALTIDDAAGRRHRLVLQRWIRPGWEADGPAFGPAKEAVVLAALEPTPIPAPQLVAVDGDGGTAGVPALLTRRLPGRPPTIRLVARASTLTALGVALAEIHRVGGGLLASGPARRVLAPYEPFGDLADAAMPARTRRLDVWRAALDLAARPAPPDPGHATLLHRDYHAWNTLWADGRLSGIVDWTSASWGPPAADLAHLRVDLAVDVSVAAAVAARAAFAAAGGDLTNARSHQVRTVFDYLTDTDVAGLPPATVDRLDAFLALVLDEPDP